MRGQNRTDEAEGRLPPAPPAKMAHAVSDRESNRQPGQGEKIEAGSPSLCGALHPCCDGPGSHEGDDKAVFVIDSKTGRGSNPRVGFGLPGELSMSLATKEFGSTVVVGENLGIFSDCSCHNYAAESIRSPIPQNPREISIFSQFEQFEMVNSLKSQSEQVRRNLRAMREFVHITGVQTIQGITVETVQRALSALKDAGRMPKTIINFKSGISAFCSFLWKRGLISYNPCFVVECAQPEETSPAVFDAFEIDALLPLARKYGIYVEVVMDIYTGLRRSELCRIEWVDVDLRNNVLTVPKSKKKRVRSIPLLAPVAAALAEQYALTAKTKYVFPAKEGWRGGFKYINRPSSPKSMTRRLKPLQQAVGNFESVAKGSVGSGWHLFRHTFATLMVSSNVHRSKCQEWMGHSSSAMLDRYTHIRPRYDPELEKILAK